MAHEIALYIAAVAIGLGGVFGLLSAIGVLRLPDLFTRMHAASKAGLFANGLILLGIAIVAAESAIILRALLGALFLALTSPVSAHLLARAAIKAGHDPLIKINTSDVQQ